MTDNADASDADVADPKIDWPGLMRAGMGVMRLSPEVFWAMTPREFDAAANPWRALAPEPMDRDAFAALRARFPDD